MGLDAAHQGDDGVYFVVLTRFDRFGFVIEIFWKSLETISGSKAFYDNAPARTLLLKYGRVKLNREHWDLFAGNTAEININRQLLLLIEGLEKSRTWWFRETYEYHYHHNSC